MSDSQMKGRTEEENKQGHQGGLFLDSRGQGSVCLFSLGNVLWVLGTIDPMLGELPGHLPRHYCLEGGRKHWIKSQPASGVEVHLSQGTQEFFMTQVSISSLGISLVLHLVS